MGINMMDWVSARLGIKPKAMGKDITCADMYEAWSENRIRELCFWSCVNIISNAVSKCEFKTYKNGREVKDHKYYLWNIEPNKNQNSSEFMGKLISKLYSDQEVLVIEHNTQLFVADAFSRKDNGVSEDIFSDIQVGPTAIKGSFKQSKVMYFKLSESNMKSIVDGLYSSYQKLISYGMKNYQNASGNKGVVEIDAIAQGDSKFEERYNDLMNNQFKSFFNSDNAVLPLFKGFTYKDIGAGRQAAQTTRDIRAMIDDIADFTAMGFGVPASLIKGNVQDTSSATDQLLTFSVDPLVDKLAEEINRKTISETEYLAGSKIVIDTKAIKHVDLLSVSTAIDKLIASGAYCINDIRRLTGDAIIDDPWAWQHFMTKNYSTMEDLLNALGGGES